MKSNIKIAVYFINGVMEIFDFEPIEGKDETDIEMKALDAFFSPKRTLLFKAGEYYIKNQAFKVKVMQEVIK
jgi:hypothetical protein